LASDSPYRAHRGLTPPSHPASTTCTGTAPVKALRAVPGAPQKNPVNNTGFFVVVISHVYLNIGCVLHQEQPE
ncbi:hypothetical protein, partial [Aliidiomarina shirensis]|uniref:hypothetical protein n=1 Tax=Aliidiomarina shirensis TaxID=1048642 RepID=UPI001A7E1747